MREGGIRMDLQQRYDQHQNMMRAFIERSKPQLRTRILDSNRTLEQEKFYQRAFAQNDFWVSMHFNQWENPIHRHEFFELIYVHRGSCTNLVDGTEVPMRAGDICLLNTNAAHTIRLDDPARDTVFNLLIRRSMMDSFHFKMFASDDFVAGFFLKSIQKQREEKNYILFSKKEGEAEQVLFFQKILQEFFSDHCYRDTKILSLFDCLMIEFIRSYQQEVDRSQAGDGSRKFSDLVKYISQNSATVTLDSLAKQFSYHPQHLSRMIKQHSGSSFRDFVTDIRLRQAGHLLREGDRPISQIMQQVGYSNRTWFNKTFAKKFGVTPHEYRSSRPQLSPGAAGRG